MRPNMYRIALLCVFLLLIASVVGCGDGSSGPQTVTFDFSKVCCSQARVAMQTDTGAFTAVTLPQNGLLSFTVPSKTTKFAVAWACGFGEPPGGSYYVEFVLEATPQDLTSFTVSNQTCNSSTGLTPPGTPAPWSYSGPTPAAFPTFAFDSYTALNGQQISEEATLSWSTNIPINPFLQNPVGYLIDVKAMPSFLNGKTAPITIPDLTAANAAIGSAPSGYSVAWTATITGSNSSVQASGNYTEP